MNSSEGVPSSTMRPLSSTTILSTLAIVDRRVCNRHHRLALHQKGELVLDRRLGFRVQRGSRLVEKEDWRVLKQHPSDGDELTLAARKLSPGSPTSWSSRDEAKDVLKLAFKGETFSAT